jgi:hypothetical protein
MLSLLLARWLKMRSNRICEIKKKRELRELPSLGIVADAKVIGANSHFDPDWSWIDADSFLLIGNE